MLMQRLSACKCPWHHVDRGGLEPPRVERLKPCSPTCSARGGPGACDAGPHVGEGETRTAARPPSIHVSRIEDRA